MDKKPTIAGIVRITELPISPIMAINFSLHVDHLVIGAQVGHAYHFNSPMAGDDYWKMLKLLHPFPDSVTVHFLEPNSDGYQSDFGLEEMLRRLDDVRPDYVLECESDASFAYGDGFEEDLQNFIEGDYDVWISRCMTAAVDDRYVPEYPISRHAWGYKWRPGISYQGGNSPGFCIPHNDLDREYKFYEGKSFPRHFPLYTQEMEDIRWRLYGPEKVKAIYDADARDRKDETGVTRPDRKEVRVNGSSLCPISHDDQERLMQR